MSYQTVLFDFDGVLCKGRFYQTLKPAHSTVLDWVQENIFGNKDRVHDWMRGNIGSLEINRLIAENTGIGFDILNGLYEESVRTMKLETDVMNLARSLKSSGKKIGIVTDNMDVFSKITIPNHRLDALFDVIINSADYGMLKKDENGRLFDIALSDLGGRIEDSLMIDDSGSTIELFKKKGGQGFIFKKPVELKTFLRI